MYPNDFESGLMATTLLPLLFRLETQAREKCLTSSQSRSQHPKHGRQVEAAQAEFHRLQHASAEGAVRSEHETVQKERDESPHAEQIWWRRRK